MWSAVGVALCRRAWGWLDEPGANGPLLGAGAVVAAVVVYRFGFSKIAARNIERIRGSVDYACVFSFQSWKGYLIIAVMVVLGVLLRHSSIPRPELAVLYTAIGGGLFLASLHYYVHFWRAVVRRDP